MMPSLFYRDKSAQGRGYEAQQGGRESLQGTQGKERRTWVAGLAISTHIVAGDIVNEILERLLITRLLALVERTVHALRSGGRPTDTIATNAWSQSQLRGGGGAKTLVKRCLRGLDAVNAEKGSPSGVEYRV